MGYNLEGGQKEDVELPLFDFATISKATNHFSIYNKLGEGGFGLVYKVRICAFFWAKDNQFCCSCLRFNYDHLIDMVEID